MANYDFTYTGAEIQAILDTAKKLKDSGYIFLGVATPSTNPGTPTQKVYYEAKQAGTYTNFGGVVLPDGISLLIWNGSWTSETVMYGDGGVFDISVYKSTGGTLATFADLSAALNGGNNIPASARKGGMSVKFVQSSDNKYVQYRLMADEWSIDTNEWAIAEEGVYVENPEFVSVKLDAEGRIIWAIRNDGSIYYGAGVPPQIVNYINEKIAELSLDEYEDIVAFLADLEKGDETLQDLLDKKVNKVNGKSLVDEDFANGIHYEDNPEFIDVKTDSENKVLEGTQKDGTKIIGGDLNVGGSANLNGDLRVLDNMEVSGVSYKVIKNPEYLAAWIDAEDKVVFGLKTDGKTYVGDADFLNDIDNIKAFLQNIIDKNIDLDALSSITAVENLEFIDVETDSEGKILSSRNNEGIKKEYVGFETPKVSIDGHTIENIEDPEGRTEITADSEGKIISYRNSDGVKHENVGLKTNHLELTTQGMTDFQKALKDSGFNPGGAGDYTDASHLEIPIPRLAFVNFKNPNGETTFPQAKLVDYKYLMEFYDGVGNYFKKEVIFNAQGQSSMSKPKKNGAIDICNNNGWDDEDTFKLKIGDWVVQDSYHLKAFYTNIFKVEPIVGYHLADLIVESRGIDVDRPWKKALLSGYTFNSDSDTSSQIDDMSLQMDNGARCWPDGFPCIVFLDGDFYGVYMWSLKKHRDNYHMSKKKAKHIHLDGTLTYESIFAGTIDWSQFEIRNPKNLCYQELHDGTYKYDADVVQDEIAGIDKNYEGDWSVGSYDIGKIVKSGKDYFINMIQDNTATPITSDASGNKNTANSPDFKNKTKCGWVNCTTSVQVKQYIIDLSNRPAELVSASTDEDKKTLLNKYFDVDNIIDYILFSQITSNYDGWSKNWQWTTWDGEKWFINYYDLDGLFGCNFVGYFAENASRSHTMDYTMEGFINRIAPTRLVYRIYADDIVTRYHQIRSELGISSEFVIKLINDMAAQIGEDYYNKEYKKWPNSECNRDLILNEGWEMIPLAYFGENPAYNPETVYEVGDECWLSYRKFRATQQRQGVQPYVQLGYHDSIWRLNKWLEERFSLLDTKYEYNI